MPRQIIEVPSSDFKKLGPPQSFNSYGFGAKQFSRNSRNSKLIIKEERLNWFQRNFPILFL